MGARPDGEKTAFRIWAPRPRRGAIIGSFNGRDGGRGPMDPEGDGCWYAEVAEARLGHEYRYLLGTPDGELSRIDSRAREVTDSVGNGAIRDPGGFARDGPIGPATGRRRAAHFGCRWDAAHV
jgi:1,4-alpha-glucan branching enzyme